ncbi:MAG: serine--tRNA ligase [Dehalococcoidia bacterium]
MLSIQTLRERTEDVRRSLANRQTEAPLDRILELDERRRELLRDVEAGRAERNAASKRIGGAKDPEERQRLIEAQRAEGSRLDALESDLKEVEAELDPLLLLVPNIPHPDVPVGPEDHAVIVIEGGDGSPERRLEAPRRVADEPLPDRDESSRPHWEVGEALGIIDFERGVRVGGSQAFMLRDDGARLQRSLIAWMLDLHRGRGYSEVYPQALVRSQMLVGTGQLPKFAETMFHLEGTDLWLIPTAEVPVTNMYRDEILAGDTLPRHHVAYSPSFRNEQFSAGRDVRGIKRVYQFDKVELVKFVPEGASWDALDTLLDDALEVVRQLGFRYRVIRLATADITFASAMTYDIEVWAPGAGEWLEVSSVSNFEDFQARRANLRYRDESGTVRYVHTLNGSGLALPRTLATILEQYALEDGSVEIPSVLRPYLGGQTSIEART